MSVLTEHIEKAIKYTNDSVIVCRLKAALATAVKVEEENKNLKKEIEEWKYALELAVAMSGKATLLHDLNEAVQKAEAKQALREIEDG